MQHVWILPLVEVLCYSTFNVVIGSNYVMEDFYSGLPCIRTYLHAWKLEVDLRLMQNWSWAWFDLRLWHAFLQFTIAFFIHLRFHEYKSQKKFILSFHVCGWLSDYIHASKWLCIMCRLVEMCLVHWFFMISSKRLNSGIYTISRQGF